MDNKPLVSIITPCYNGENYVGRFLDSVLGQTYSNIELIIINDGSTDNTEKIIKSYREKFLQKNYRFIYLKQENSGQAEAVNNGLKHFEGYYLAWPDSDDFYDFTSIEKRVQYLESNTGYGFVRSNANFVYENDLSHIVKTIADGNVFNENIFLDLITEKTFVQPGPYLLRASSFLTVNPEREIYPSRAGQNWQMLLPIAYKFQCGYIDESLYNYVIRPDSHSRSVTDTIDKYNRCKDHEEILVNTINKISMTDNEKRRYLHIIDEKYAHKRFKYALDLKNKREKEYKNLKNKKYLTIKERILYALSKLNLTKVIKMIRNN